jgi:hypothetical protein
MSNQSSLQKVNIMNLDQLLDGSFDQLADKPEFKPFPAGQHAVQTFFKSKKFGENGKDGEGFEVKFKYMELVELTDPSKEVPKAGAESTLQLNLTAKDDFQRESGQGNFKIIMAALAAKHPGLNVRQLIEAGQGQAAIITTGTRMNKDKTGEFLTLSAIQYA